MIGSTEPVRDVTKDKAQGTTGVTQAIYGEVGIGVGVSEVRSKNLVHVGWQQVVAESTRRISGSGEVGPVSKLLTEIG